MRPNVCKHFKGEDTPPGREAAIHGEDKCKCWRRCKKGAGAHNDQHRKEAAIGLELLSLILKKQNGRRCRLLLEMLPVAGQPAGDGALAGIGWDRFLLCGWRS